jgi:hypothetical protein
MEKKKRFITSAPYPSVPCRFAGTMKLLPPMLAIMQKEAEGVSKMKQNGYTLCIRVGSV